MLITLGEGDKALKYLPYYYEGLPDSCSLALLHVKVIYLYYFSKKNFTYKSTTNTQMEFDLYRKLAAVLDPGSGGGGGGVSPGDPMAQGCDFCFCFRIIVVIS